jgi:hypothetical protein
MCCGCFSSAATRPSRGSGRLQAGRDREDRGSPQRGDGLRGVDARLRAVRQDAPPRIISVIYELIVDTDENDQRLELLHSNVRKYGTIFNTVSEATNLQGTLSRKG